MALGEFIIMWNNMFYNGKWKKKPNLSKEWTKHEFLYDHLVHPLNEIYCWSSKEAHFDGDNVNAWPKLWIWAIL